jgi:hypothetical protein
LRSFVHSGQPGLDGKPPAEVIAAGQVERVVELIKHTKTREETDVPAAKDPAEQRTKGSALLAAMASRKPSRSRDQLGMRHPVTAISEEREASYELQDEPAPPRGPGRTTGITYSHKEELKQRIRERGWTQGSFLPARHDLFLADLGAPITSEPQQLREAEGEAALAGVYSQRALPGPNSPPALRGRRGAATGRRPDPEARVRDS